MDILSDGSLLQSQHWGSGSMKIRSSRSAFAMVRLRPRINKILFQKKKTDKMLHKTKSWAGVEHLPKMYDG